MPIPESSSSGGRSPHHIFGRLLFLGCLALAAYPFFRGKALETELRYRLGEEHARYEALSLRYVHEGVEVAGGRFYFPGGAPATFDHTVSLPEGSIEVELSLTGEPGLSATRRHRFETPAEGKVVLAW